MNYKPKFLTAEMAERAIELVHDMIQPQETLANEKFFRLKRGSWHVVVLVPEMQATGKDEDVRGQVIHNYPDYPINPVVLAERSFGDRSLWSADYKDVARCKAVQLWHGRNDGRTDIMPHLLYSGDCPFWGGVKRDGIVVACSGVEPWFDRMIAGMVADMCIAGAYHAWMKSADKKDDLDNLS
jgi:hypothetical protein